MTTGEVGDALGRGGLGEGVDPGGHGVAVVARGAHHLAVTDDVLEVAGHAPGDRGGRADDRDRGDAEVAQQVGVRGR